MSRPVGHIQVHQHTQWKSQKKGRETEKGEERKAENSQDVIKDMNLYSQEAQPLQEGAMKKDPFQDT